MFMKLFKWEGQGVIFLDVKVNNMVAKSVYNPGCTRVALSQYFVKKTGLPLNWVVLLTLSLANGVTTINQSVFDLINIKWKATNVDLPTVVFPEACFDLLLGLKWIFKAGVGLNAECQVLVH